MSDPLRLLVVGAHPDDAEYKAGGLAAIYRGLGHDVRFLSLTDGSAGHHAMPGPALARRRRLEAEIAAASIGAEAEVWGVPDGRLEPSLPNRERLIRAIRRYRPDLVLTHRPNDYHPDHRATAQLVMDAAYLLTVPSLCPDVPHLPRDPVVAYMADEFTRPYPFTPSVVVDISAVWDAKAGMLHAHASQMYEWLPYNMGHADEVPEDDDARRAWLAGRLDAISARLADRIRPAIVAAFGPDRGASLSRVEAFEGAEHGSPLDDDALRRLFPFAPPLPRPG